jgi:hypothetical protein
VLLCKGYDLRSSEPWCGVRERERERGGGWEDDRRAPRRSIRYKHTKTEEAVASELLNTQKRETHTHTQREKEVAQRKTHREGRTVCKRER